MCVAGTGKTLLARAVAAECGASFLVVHPSTVASKWLGDGVRYVRAVFSLAAKLAPCVIFLDEVCTCLCWSCHVSSGSCSHLTSLQVDALLSRRNSTMEHESIREIKNEFMAGWEGIRCRLC